MSSEAILIFKIFIRSDSLNPNNPGQKTLTCPDDYRLSADYQKRWHLRNIIGNKSSILSFSIRICIIRA